MKEFVKDLLLKIENNGFEAYVVGGFVRDSILNIETKDIDITTSALPEELKKIFKEDLIIYEKYKASHLLNQKYNVDINTFRKEKKYHNNKPIDIEIVTDLKTDLLRRDFTINALCFDKELNLIDLINGKKDLDNQLIKVIGDVTEKFNEDNTRIIKAIRLMCFLNFKLELPIIEYIKNHRDFTSKINVHVYKKELDKILTVNPQKFVEFIETNNFNDIFGIDPKNFKISSSLNEMYSQMKLVENFPLSQK